MRHRSTFWFVIAAAWFVLLVLNLMRHHDLNTLVIGLAVAVFLVIGHIVPQPRSEAFARADSSGSQQPRIDRHPRHCIHARLRRSASISACSRMPPATMS